MRRNHHDFPTPQEAEAYVNFTYRLVDEGVDRFIAGIQLEFPGMEVTFNLTDLEYRLVGLRDSIVDMVAVEMWRHELFDRLDGDEE